MDEQSLKKQLINEADLLRMLGKLLSKWKLILCITLAFMVLGVLVALFRIKLYTAEVVVAPETKNSTSLNSAFSSISNIFGMNIDAFASEDAIYPLLYPDIIKSLPFLSSLFSVNVQTIDGSVNTTYYNYVSRHLKKSPVAMVQTAPIRAVRAVGNIISPPKKEDNPSYFDPYRLSKRQMKMIDRLAMSIGVFVDKKTNVVKVSYTDQDPLVATIITDTIMKRVQDLIIEYRTKKIINDCQYIENQYNNSKLEYEQAQERYAEYIDKNRNVTKERFVVEGDRLEAEKDLKNVLYTQWAQQLMLTKARVQERTPVFVTIKPASIPALPSSMSGLMILIIYTILGLFVGVSFVLFKNSIIRTFNLLFKRKKK